MKSHSRLVLLSLLSFGSLSANSQTDDFYLGAPDHARAQIEAAKARMAASRAGGLHVDRSHDRVDLAILAGRANPAYAPDRLRFRPLGEGLEHRVEGGSLRGFTIAGSVDSEGKGTSAQWFVEVPGLGTLAISEELFTEERRGRLTFTNTEVPFRNTVYPASILVYVHAGGEPRTKLVWEAQDRIFTVAADIDVASHPSHWSRLHAIAGQVMRMASSR